jgi:HEPN domain-containing protein
MAGPERAIQVVGEWIQKAESDLTNAIHALKLGARCPTDTVCFHAQQCIEKYLKALLTLRGIAFPKTHNIRMLMDRTPSRDRPPVSDDEQDALTDYATGARYPGWGEIPLAEARRAVAAARRVRKEIRRRVPKEALHRKKR